ncbi:MAG: Uma2 family endonuclease [Deltaproteobacteria bacterium]
MVQPIHHRFEWEDYLRLEADSGQKHEFLAGQVWAMAGGSPEHARMSANVMAQLLAQLAGKPCAVFTSDLRIGVRATGLVTYPDVSVVCGALERDPIDRTGNTIANPKVLIEVLSPSTAEYDRGEKLVHYQQIESLDAIVHFAYEAQRAEVWERRGNAWTPREERERVELATIGCTITLADVYRDPLAAP